MKKCPQAGCQRVHVGREYSHASDSALEAPINPALEKGALHQAHLSENRAIIVCTYGALNEDSARQKVPIETCVL